MSTLSLSRSRALRILHLYIYRCGVLPGLLRQRDHPHFLDVLGTVHRRLVSTVFLAFLLGLLCSPLLTFVPDSSVQRRSLIVAR